MDHFAILKEGLPRSVMYGGFPSGPIKELGSSRVTKESSKQEVHPGTISCYAKLMFSGFVLLVFMF